MIAADTSGTPTWLAVLAILVGLSGPLVAYLSVRNARRQADSGEHRLTMNDLNAALDRERERLTEERDELRAECHDCSTKLAASEAKNARLTARVDELERKITRLERRP